MGSLIREKKIYCGNKYLEVDIYNCPDGVPKHKRALKKKESAPKQKNLNDKNAKRYLIQLVNTNFDKDDICVTCTYKDKYLPNTVDEAEKEVKNYLRRLQRKRKAMKLPDLKYVLVTEYKMKGEKPVRIHHHILMNGELSRDIVESLWCRRKKKGEKTGERLGRVNADRLQPDDTGLEALCRYATKGCKEEKDTDTLGNILNTSPSKKNRWSVSKNLKKPIKRIKDGYITNRKLQKMVQNIDDREQWEKRYKGYILTEAVSEYNEISGWYIRLKMRRRH